MRNSRRDGRFNPGSLGSYSAHYGIGTRTPRKRRPAVLRRAILACILLGSVGITYVLMTAPPAPPSLLLTILSPEPDATVSGGPTLVSVQLREGTRLVDTATQSGADGYHLLYYLNAEPPTDPGRPALTASTTCFSTQAMSHTWNLVGPGKHRLFVQVVRSNDTPLSPPVVASVIVRVPASASSATAPSTAAPTRASSGGGC